MKEKKLNFYIDVDNTLIKSTNAMARWYNEHYSYHPEFKTAKGELIKKWDGKDQMPLLKSYEVEEMFDSKDFYQHNDIYENAYDVLKELYKSNKFNIIFCSIGTSHNIANKTIFLEEYFPFIKQHMMLVKNYGTDLYMNKEKIVSDGLILDDHQDNMTGLYNVMFCDRGITEWNYKKYDDVTKVHNWLEVKELTYKIYKNYCWRYKV